MNQLLKDGMLEHVIWPPHNVRNGLRIGRVHSITSGGEVLVTFPGNTNGPLAAKVLLGTVRELENLSIDSHVLLGFVETGPSIPIIFGVLADTISISGHLTERRGVSLRPRQEVTIDGNTLTLEGEKEIVLKSGNGSITIRQDGKIILKGTSIVSRSSGRNKIRGASVEVN